MYSLLDMIKQNNNQLKCSIDQHQKTHCKLGLEPKELLGLELSSEDSSMNLNAEDLDFDKTLAKTGLVTSSEINEIKMSK